MEESSKTTGFKGFHEREDSIKENQNLNSKTYSFYEPPIKNYE